MNYDPTTFDVESRRIACDKEYIYLAVTESRYVPCPPWTCIEDIMSIYKIRKADFVIINKFELMKDLGLNPFVGGITVDDTYIYISFYYFLLPTVIITVLQKRLKSNCNLIKDINTDSTCDMTCDNKFLYTKGDIVNISAGVHYYPVVIRSKDSLAPIVLVHEADGIKFKDSKAICSDWEYTNTL